MKNVITKLNLFRLQIITVLNVILIAIIFNQNIQAAASPYNSFSVRPVTPENYGSKSKSYFDLVLEPNETKTVQVEITNTADKEFIAKVRLNPASTGNNGVILYKEQETWDESLKIPITEIASLRKTEIKIPGKGKAKVDIDIKMTDKKYDGVILGGVSISGEEISETANENQGVKINNSISYTVALKIAQNTTVVNPELNIKSITPGLYNYKTAVLVNIQNSATAIVKELEIDAEIYKKGSDKVFREYHLAGAEMAPNSNANFVINWKDGKLEPGEYRLKMSASSNNGKKWDWDEKFTIGNESKDLNKGAINNANTGFNYWYIIIPILLLLIILIAYVSYRLGSKKNNEED